MIEVAPLYVNELTQAEALLYCAFLEYNGHKDWRLPTYLEYTELDDLGCWHIDRTDKFKWYVKPVRDINE